MPYASCQTLPRDMTSCNTRSGNVTARPLRSSGEGAVEAVGHVDGHVGSRHLLKRLGIQNQEEGPSVLQQRKRSLGELVSSSARAAGSFSCRSLAQLQPGLILSLIIRHRTSSRCPRSLFPLCLAFSCDTVKSVASALEAPYK